MLSLAGKEYGKNIIKQYSEKLVIEVRKKYNERNLRYMRQFYELFEDQIWNTACSKLTWSHYREVLSLKDINKIRYYLNECENKNLTIKELQVIIKNKEYDRLSEETKNKMINLEQLKVDDLVPNPIIVRSNALNEKLTEYSLKQMILNNLDEFLLQLGNAFTYVGNEYKIKVDGKYNYIDFCYLIMNIIVS